jgi:hypothetical protein
MVWVRERTIPTERPIIIIIIITTNSVHCLVILSYEKELVNYWIVKWPQIFI